MNSDGHRDTAVRKSASATAANQSNSFNENMCDVSEQNMYESQQPQVMLS